jgi:hypothetical protein
MQRMLQRGDGSLVHFLNPDQLDIWRQPSSLSTGQKSAPGEAKKRTGDQTPLKIVQKLRKNGCFKIYVKYSEIVKAPKLVVRKETAIAMLDHGGLFERLVRHGWLRPCDTEQKPELFLVCDLEEATRRLKRERLSA